MIVKLFVIFLLLLIVGSLGSAMIYLLKDQGKSTRVVQALTFRISLSIFAFLILMVSSYFGLIEPNNPFPQAPR
jgi:putative copper export protein